jgi:predicted small secreted protein
MLKRIILGLFAAVALVTAVTGCHTVGGASEDVENVNAVPSNVPPPP